MANWDMESKFCKKEKSIRNQIKKKKNSLYKLKWSGQIN